MRVSVLGAGAWGTVIAWLLANNGHAVRLWSRRREHAAAIESERVNREYLPHLPLPAAVTSTSDLRHALDEVALAFVAVPSRALRSLMSSLPAVPTLVSCSKGMELTGFRRLSQVMEDERPGVTVAALSGPNLAGEIAAGLPAATTVASADQEVALSVQALLQQRTFRVYTSSDVAGVELAGAMKNVIALAAGICDGLGLGDNAKSTIITRGLAELVRLGTLLGGETRTFYGLAGIGDIIATCSSQQSRNHTAGMLLAAGDDLDDLRARNLTAEGVPTVEAVHRYAEANDIDLPITAEVYRVVYQGKPARAAMVDLMTRERKPE
jgi:glycerol-3-phosphate dehydrogenase (NAD(P)+)